MKKQHFPTSFGVIGLGRFGTALVQTLAEAGKEVIAVDKDEAKVKAVRKYTDFAFVIETLSEESLEETGIQNCQTVTICIGEKVDVSVLTTMMVIKMAYRTSFPKQTAGSMAKCSSIWARRLYIPNPIWRCALASA